MYTTCKHIKKFLSLILISYFIGPTVLQQIQKLPKLKNAIAKTASSYTSTSSFAADVYVRIRRSNFPCGRSFVRCVENLTNEDEADGFPGGSAPFSAVAFGAKTNKRNGLDDEGSELISSLPELERLSAASGDDEIRELSKVLSERSIRTAATAATAEVNELFDVAEPRMFREFQSTNFLYSTLAWADLTAVDSFAKNLSRPALAAIRTTQAFRGLNPDQVYATLPQMSVERSTLHAACPLNLIIDCVAGKYRTYSGHCNNVVEPLWGAAYEPFQRAQAPQYADGIGAIRWAKSTNDLPSARLVSRRIFSTQTGNSSASASAAGSPVTLLVAQWSLFVYEDLARIGSNQLLKNNSLLPIPCCADQHPECMPIITDASDQSFRGRGQCLPFSRSIVSPRQNCTLGVREQNNLVSSFLDGSHIYGRDKAESRELRSFSNGMLKTSAQPQRLDLLPADLHFRSCLSTSALRPCFRTGSTMTNLMPTSAALHTIFVRHHNRIAKQLLEFNPHWSDERLYQETRRLVIAQLQHITFNEWLPILVGRDRLRIMGLQLRLHSFDSDYNMRTNPSTLNEYASAAGLFHFAILPSEIAAVERDGQYVLPQSLSQTFNDPSQLYQRDRVDGLIRFLLQEPARPASPTFNDELREKFLRGGDLFGLDLAALILQWGRDHGINSYAAWRRECGLSTPDNFDALRELFREDFNFTALVKLYETVEDVDLFLAGLAERPMNGALLGPTFGCIIGRQFEKIRHGDRFWYENFFQPSAFTEAQLNEIRQTNLASIFCDNTYDFGMIQPDVFQVPDNFGNCPISCNATMFTRPNLRHWIDQEPKAQLPITQQTLEKAVRIGAEQFRRLQEAESGRISRQRASASPTFSGTRPPVLAHAALMAPKRESLDIARTAGILRETTNVLLKGNGLETDERLPAELDIVTLQRLLPEVDVQRIVGNITNYLGPHVSPTATVAEGREQCLPRPLPCDHTDRYRTFSGWCNNLRFPYYGNAFEPLRRMREPVYDDGFDSPRTRARGGRTLPSARRVSNIVHTDAPAKFHVKFTHMVMQMGQMIDHDMTHSPIARGPNNAILNCSRCDSAETLSIHCFPITIDSSDPFFPSTHADGQPRCMPFARSLLGQLTLGYRNQLNQLTSFLDASNIYGSTDCEANVLRLFSKGRLNFTDLGYNHQALPQGLQERDCRSRPLHPCFNAGDERSNEQPGLAVLHTILLREHNRISTTLSQINNFWDDERVYQETRRIMIAKQQHIVFAEWLPVVLGCEAMARYDLAPRRSGYYTGYDPTCDASVSQEFATSAMRFGHTLIRAAFPRMNATARPMAEPVALESNFNNASALYDAAAGHMESLLMGLVGVPGMDYDRHIVEPLRNHLFQKPGGPLTGLDLPAVNIQRSRDHGIQPYNAYRELCGLPTALSFDDLLDTMDESAVAALKTVYAHVDDIDLFPGIMSERPMKGALVGPMVGCLLAEQFRRSKRCDRFYYENDDSNTRFTPAQLAEIRKTTLSKMLCDNSDFAKRIQPNAFLLPDNLTNAPVKCSELPFVDLYEWLDRQFCVVDQRVINLGKTRRITPCITCTCTTEGPECHSTVVENCERLFDDYLLSDIKRDSVCVIQCARALRERDRRFRDGFPIAR